MKKTTNLLFNILLAFIPISLLVSPAINAILIVLLFLYTVVFRSKENRFAVNNNITNWVSYTYILFLVIHVLGMLYTENTTEGLARINVKYSLLLIPVVFYINYKKINFSFLKYFFVYAVIFFSLFTNLHSIIQVIQLDKELSWFFLENIRVKYENLMFYSIHMPYYGMFLNIAVIFVNYDLLIEKKNMLLNALLMVILVLNLILISSQTSLFIFMFISFVYLLTLIKKQINVFFMRVFLLISILFTTIIAFNGEQITTKIIVKTNIKNENHIIKRINHFYKKSDLTRKNNWKSGLQVIKENPFFGVGTGDALDEMQKHRNKRLWIYKQKLNAHNQYIEETVRFGFFGLVVFLMFLIFLNIHTKNNFKYQLIIFTFAFSMITESILNRQVGVVLFSFFLSYTYFNCKKTTSNNG